MEIFTYIFFFILFSLFHFALNYYFKLFFLSTKQTYQRNEILNLVEIVKSELKEFSIDQVYPIFAYLASIFGFIFIYFWSRLGIFNQYHYTSEMENYFFHSFLIVLFFALIFIYLNQKYQNSHYSNTLNIFLNQKKYILLSLNSSCIAQNLTTYIIHKQFSILFTLCNIVILLVINLLISNNLLFSNLDKKNEEEFLEL